ncbi:MAG TPA: serine/threonine-protein kinase [Polyangia bacterium]|nr:serine/threonine-protein kinase [Polyangia bacterium]
MAEARHTEAVWDDALAESYARETADTNRRRLRVLAPLMLCVHAAHVAFFATTGVARARLSAEVLEWRDLLALTHAVMLPLLALITVLVYTRFGARTWRWLGPATGALYLLHGAWVAGVDQLVSTNISVYVGYCFGVAVVTPLSPRVAIASYAAGAALLLGSLMRFQHDAHARLTNFPTCLTLTVFCIAFAWHLHVSRRREFGQRAIIDRQRDELSALNAGLEQRVREQVQEIVARADEVDRLNAQLQAQVRARSVELSVALARLAEKRSSNGRLTPGLVLADRFVVADLIGSGGMGAVYAGRDQTTGARVAIKVIQAGSSDQLDAMRRFIREVSAATAVAHPAVVRILHLDVSDDGMLFQAQELVEGKTLTRYLAREWRAAEAARLGAVICDALAAAHAHGVVHRDVKPDNIMLVPAAPGLKLLDFGIAKLYDAFASSGGPSTRVRTVIGTPGYMAPEQLDAIDVSDRADVYAVGVILHQLLTGRLPTDSPSGARPLEPALGYAVARCLVREPRARPSAEALGAELRAFADAHGAPPLETLAALPLDGDVPAPVTTTPARRGNTPA